MSQQILLEQLKQDVANLKNDNYLFSDAVLQVPRFTKVKENQEAKKFAVQLFQEDVTDPIKRKYSYIRYTQILRDIKKKYLAQHPPVDNTTNMGCGCSTKYPQYKLARTHGKIEIYQQLLNNPPQEPVLNPTAMPVEVSPWEELEPFFNYLSHNYPPVSLHQDKNGEYISFKRGAYYTDGRIDLCKQVVGPPWIGKLMKSIKDNPHVEHFLLGNNIIGPQGGQSIGEFLSNPERKCQIKTWYLAGNDLDAKGIRPICENLTEDKVCQSLWLKRNPLTPQGIQWIGKMLETNRSIQILDLVNTACFDEGIEYLFTSLKKNTSLRFLYLDSNAITAKSVPFICQYFQTLIEEKRVGITNLSLGINRLGDEGIMILMDTLKHYPHLERLIISSNRIQLKGLSYTLQALQNHPGLVLLDMGMYKATPDLGELPNHFQGGGDMIADFIQNNKTLKVLDITTSHLDEKDLDTVAQAMEKNHHLIYVKMEQHGLKTDSSKKSLKQIQNICKRNILEKKLDYGQVMKDFRFYKHLPSVRFIDSIYRNNM